MSAHSGEFSLEALYAALDTHRQARGLSWAEAVREMNGVRVDALAAGTGSRLLSASTVSGLRNRTAAEADGVLQMLVWLGRAPEDFLEGAITAPVPRLSLPRVAEHQILRFDTRRLHAAIEVQRDERGITWSAVAGEIGVGGAALARYAAGTRTAFPAVMRITGWLGKPAAEFTRAVDRSDAGA